MVCGEGLELNDKGSAHQLLHERRMNDADTIALLNMHRW